MKCDTCEERESIGVAAIPGMPMSVAWCQECLQSGAIPWWAAVGNTAIIGGLVNAAEWWVEIVEATLKHLDRTKEEFEGEVAVRIKELLEEEWKPQDD